MKTQILDNEQVKKIIKRMAFQVYETFIDEKELVISAIDGNGVQYAKLLIKEIEGISKLKLHFLIVSLNKKMPKEDQISLSDTKLDLKNKSVLLVDDVLNTGRTLLYSSLPFLKAKVKRLKTAVLVDRNHKEFPVAADFIGLSLSTTLKEHVSVEIENKKINVYLK